MSISIPSVDPPSLEACFRQVLQSAHGAKNDQNGESKHFHALESGIGLKNTTVVGSVEVMAEFIAAVKRLHVTL